MNRSVQDQKRARRDPWLSLRILLLLVILMDLLGQGFITFHKGLPAKFLTSSPGTIIWDLWIVGLARVFLVLLALTILEYPSGKESKQTGGAVLSVEQRYSRAKALCFSALIVTELATAGKCLTRLIAGCGNEQETTLWFWAAIGFGVLMSLLDYIVCRRCIDSHRKRWEEEDLARDLRDPLLQEEGRLRKNEKKGKSNASVRDLLCLIIPDSLLVSVAFVFLVAAAICQVLIPHFTGNIVDSIIENRDDSQFRKYTLYLIISASLCGIFTGLRGGIFTVVGARVNVRIRDMLFKALMKQEIGFYDTTKTGEISSRLNADTTKVGDQVSLNVNFFLRNLVQAIGTLCYMFLQSWKLSTVAFISVPIVVVVSKYYGEYIRKLSKRSQEALAKASSVAEEALSSMSTVRSFACEEEEERLYRAHLREYYKLNVKEAWAYSLYACMTSVLPNFVTALVLFYGGKLVLTGEISSGKLVSFLLYLSSLSDAFNNMGSIFSAFTQALGSADKVYEYIKRQPKILTSRGTKTSASCKGGVALVNIQFRYPARPAHKVLDDLTLNISPGSVVALVGASGGGKSTCVALLERFYEPEKGQVLLDGQSVRDYDHKWYHRNISIVGQEPTLFARTIKKNIIFGLEETEFEPTDEEVVDAAKLANAHQFIMAMEKGYDTEVGERGVQLSGGQKQRIAIARALVRKPRVLLLDEATSALDCNSEELVQSAIDDMIAKGGMTVIIIAHRLSTVKNADCIFVFEHGQVVEQGRHEYLISQGGVYAQLVSKQIQAGNR